MAVLPGALKQAVVNQERQAVSVMSVACNFFIRGLHLNSLWAAFLLATWSGTSAVAALLARRLPLRLQGSGQLGFALLGVAIGEVIMMWALPGPTWLLIPGLVVAGIASGVLNTGLGREAVASVPAGRASLGSGANNTARYLGSSVGVTALMLLAPQPAGGSVGAWNHAVALSAATSAFVAIVVLAYRRQAVAGA